MKFKVGDRVKVVSCPMTPFIGQELTVMQTRQVTPRSHTGFVEDNAYCVNGGLGMWFHIDQLELINDRLKKGDRVRVVADNFHAGKRGEEGTIIKVDSTKTPYYVRMDNGNESWAVESRFELINDNNMELKITKEKVLEAASKCSDAKRTLEVLFPEAFESDYLKLNYTDKGIVNSDGELITEHPWHPERAQIYIKAAYKVELIPGIVGGTYIKITRK